MINSQSKQRNRSYISCQCNRLVKCDQYPNTNQCKRNLAQAFKKLGRTKINICTYSLIFLNVEICPITLYKTYALTKALHMYIVMHSHRSLHIYPNADSDEMNPIPVYRRRVMNCNHLSEQRDMG